MNETAKVTINGHELDARVSTRWNDTSNSRRSYAKIYLTVPDPEDLGQCQSAPRYGRKGDDPTEDAKWRAYNKLEKQNQRAVIDAIFPELVGKKGVVFSRFTGCSCGCSPGWTVKEYVPGLNRWADVYLQATKPVDPDAAALQAFLADAKANGAVV